MSKHKQPTLLNYGFTKKVWHRGEIINVVSPAVEKKMHSSSNCKKEFKTSQALSMHKHCCKNLHHRTSPERPPIILNERMIQNQKISP